MHYNLKCILLLEMAFCAAQIKVHFISIGLTILDICEVILICGIDMGALPVMNVFASSGLPQERCAART